MKIAVLGAGFAGLSVAFHLLQKNPDLTVTIIDAEEIGGGASGLSSGLLNPFGGLRAKKAWNAESAICSAKKLIHNVEESFKDTIISEGILRPACIESQIRDFKSTALKFSETTWLEKEECLQQIPSLKLDLEGAGALFIKDGLTINVQKYLKGLWNLCELKGARLEKRRIQSLDELNEFNKVICALGAGSHALFKDYLPPLTIVKGQLLIFEWTSQLSPFPYSLVSQGYLVMSEDQKSCMAGATFERNPLHLEPDLEFAKKELMPKIALFFPTIYDLPLLDCKAGARLSYQSHLPIVDQISEKFWLLTAMGSKGLIYHAWLGDLLAGALIHDDPSSIPQEFRLKK